MNLQAVRDAMHIPKSFRQRWAPEKDLAWNCSQDDPVAFRSNFTNCAMQDYRPMIRDIAAEYPFLVYSGDVDAQLPHVATERWTAGLGFDEVEPWRPWTVSGDYVGGYVTRYEHNFTYATVKGAGHMVPTYRPMAAQTMVRRFIEGQRLCAGQQHLHLMPARRGSRLTRMADAVHTRRKRGGRQKS